MKTTIEPSFNLRLQEAEISGFYRGLLAKLLVDLLRALTVKLHIPVLPSVHYQNPSGQEIESSL